MKIALLTHKLIPPLIGGVDVYTDRLGRALQRLGHKVFYVAFDATGDGDEIAVVPDDHNGTPVWRVRFAFEALPKEAFDTVYNPEMGQIAGDIFSRQRPDMVIIINFYMITLAPVEAAKALGIPVAHIATDFVPVCRQGTFMRWDGSTCQVGESIQTCSTCFVSHRFLGRVASTVLERLPESTIANWAAKKDTYRLPNPKWIAKPFLNHSAVMVKRLARIRPLRELIDLVLVPTPFTYDTFVANGFRADQVHLLPFGIDEDNPLATVETSPADHVRFMFLGRLQPYKGCHLAVEAFNGLSNANGATLTIYGAPDMHDDYFVHLKAMMNANERIHFAGLIPPTELASAFAQADIFLLPSTWHENSPLILLDALQSRTPVIGSDIGGVSGIVAHEVNGLLFPMGDVAALRGSMQRVIDDPALIQQWQSGGQLNTIDQYAQILIAQMQARQLQLEAVVE